MAVAYPFPFPYSYPFLESADTSLVGGVWAVQSASASEAAATESVVAEQPFASPPPPLPPPSAADGVGCGDVSGCFAAASGFVYCSDTHNSVSAESLYFAVPKHSIGCCRAASTDAIGYDLSAVWTVRYSIDCLGSDESSIWAGSAAAADCRRHRHRQRKEMRTAALKELNRRRRRCLELRRCWLYGLSLETEKMP